LALKDKIVDDFVPNTFDLFNLLGEVDFAAMRQPFAQQDKEVKQFITLRSLTTNLHKVFGIRNDFFAQMLFTYLSDRAPLTYYITYSGFLKKLLPFFPQK